MGDKVPILTRETIGREEHIGVLEISVQRVIGANRVGLRQIRFGSAGGEGSSKCQQKEMGLGVAADPKGELKLFHSGVHMAPIGLSSHLSQPFHTSAVDQDLSGVLFLLHAHHRSTQT